MFTTRAVVSFLATNPLADKDKADLAADLSDALGELLGKPLEKPTARGIGKIFQRHLTGRNTWIDVGDGRSIAVLRKDKGHDANKYRVEVSTSTDKSEAEPDEARDAEPWEAAL